MVELESDLDLTTHPVQDGSRNRLLGIADRGVDIGEGPRTNSHFRRSYGDVSPEYSDDATPPQLRSVEDPYQGPDKAQINVTNTPLKPPSHVYWDGHPFYALTWDVLGILVSICFLGTLSRALHTWDIADAFTVLGAFVAHLKGQEQSAWSLRVLQVTKLAPSLWPIFFSGVLGNAVRALADWRVERGVDLMV
jgi:hypothetical protein